MNTKRQSGAEIVEFAFILPILLGVLFTVMQLGWLLFNQVVLTSAASAGARVLATQRGYDAPYTDTRNAVLTAAGMLPNFQNTLRMTLEVGGTQCASDSVCTPALGNSSTAPAAGAQAGVFLEYPFIPIFGSWFGMAPLTLRATMHELVQ